ncbi:hypothetical protein M9458_011678, partial [Cirrhinus mrigala]
PRHVTSDCPESRHFTSAAPRSSSLVSSVRDPPLVFSRAAGIPKPALTNLPVPEVIPLSAALPIWGIAFWCLWATIITAKTPEPSTPTDGSPEVVAEAAEPPEMAVPAPDLPEVVAQAAEPSEAVPFTSALVPVVAPTYELSACPVTAMEAVTELSACTITALEAVVELSARMVMTMVAVYELSALSVVPTETANKPTAFPAFVFVALSVSSVSVFPRSQFPPWVTALSAPPWRAPGPSVLFWWPSASPIPPAPPWFPSPSLRYRYSFNC